MHERIKIRRERLGLSLTEFAEQVGVHISVASHWENRRARPGIERLSKIAAVLGVSEMYLVRGESAWATYEKALRRAA